GFVYALHKHDGSVVWERELKPGFWKTGKDFVTLLEGKHFLFACAFGIVFCLRKDDGSVVWQNEIKKLKHDVASLAVDATLLAAQPNAQGSDAAIGVDGDSGSDGSGGDGGGGD
ncbi:MAG: hypothetical protein AAGE65_03780, partial [Planctomycetota bacterium]